jgi:uncharacterized protein YodC (DUF2158 family)
MSDEIKVGDVVQVKSGSTVMTVEAINDHLGTESALCAYDLKGARKTEWWPLTSLKHAKT